MRREGGRGEGEEHVLWRRIKLCPGWRLAVTDPPTKQIGKKRENNQEAETTIIVLELSRCKNMKIKDEKKNIKTNDSESLKNSSL